MPRPRADSAWTFRLSLIVVSADGYDWRFEFSDNAIADELRWAIAATIALVNGFGLLLFLDGGGP